MKTQRGDDCLKTRNRVFTNQNFDLGLPSTQNYEKRNFYYLSCVVEKVMATHSSTLAWKIPWTEEPGRLQSMGSLRAGHD